MSACRQGSQRPGWRGLGRGDRQIAISETPTKFHGDAALPTMPAAITIESTKPM